MAVIRIKRPDADDGDRDKCQAIYFIGAPLTKYTVRPDASRIATVLVAG